MGFWVADTFSRFGGTMIEDEIDTFTSITSDKPFYTVFNTKTVHLFPVPLFEFMMFPMERSLSAIFLPTAPEPYWRLKNHAFV